MLKRLLISFINGFCYAIAITMVIQLIAMRLTGDLPMLEEFMTRFSDPITAYATQLLLIGIMSGITSAGTIVFESKRIGLLAQSILFLIIMLSIWIPTACYAWGFHKYYLSMLITIISIIVSYSISWGIVYKLSRRDIEEINAILSERKGVEK